MEVEEIVPPSIRGLERASLTTAGVGLLLDASELEGVNEADWGKKAVIILCNELE